MSRTLYQNQDDFLTEISSMDECRHLINDVCCNKECIHIGEYAIEECSLCSQFTEEDGVID